MTVSGLNHYTIRCTPSELDTLREFYTRCLELQAGARPVMPAPGFWLYGGGQPLVHLYAGEQSSLAGPTAALDHISFRAHGLERTRKRLREQGHAFDEAPVAGWPLYQLFLRDPFGMKIELTFDLDEERGGAGAAAR
jgi:catechol 2,3-dioxygenase-like lactoylglutathione lyase family enzyme